MAKRLRAVPHSLDVLAITAVIAFGGMIATLGLNWGGILAGLAVVFALFLNNYLMFLAAYRDGFRGGYTTAQNDHADLGFVPERSVT